MHASDGTLQYFMKLLYENVSCVSSIFFWGRCTHLCKLRDVLAARVSADALCFEHTRLPCMDACQGEYDPQQNVTLIDNHRGGYHISYVLHPNAVRCCDYLYRI